jgi:hypothetical protein
MKLKGYSFALLLALRDNHSHSFIKIHAVQTAAIFYKKKKTVNIVAHRL